MTTRPRKVRKQTRCQIVCVRPVFKASKVPKRRNGRSELWNAPLHSVHGESRSNPARTSAQLRRIVAQEALADRRRKLSSLRGRAKDLRDATLESMEAPTLRRRDGRSEKAMAHIDRRLISMTYGTIPSVTWLKKHSHWDGSYYMELRGSDLALAKRARVDPSLSTTSLEKVRAAVVKIYKKEDGEGLASSIMETAFGIEWV